MKFSSSKQLVQIFLALCLAMLSVVCRAEVESLTFIHSDHLGSPIIATDQQGEVLWRKDYQPFGSSTSSAHSDNSVGFTGHIEDDSLGLTYMQGRWYHPELGRFTGIDPVGFVDGNVSSFNRYAYANNNPYRYTDPDGKIPVDTLFDAANVVYDLGKAGFGAATGNSALVAEGLADAAADAVAMAIPYVPAGSSKVARMAVEAAEEASEKNVGKGGPPSLPEGIESYQLELFPREHYQRVKHYGNTPTAAQKASVPQGMEFDHDPMLVKHYYEGPGDGSLPGYNLTSAERKAFGARLDAGGPATPAQQRAQGAAAAHYSKEQKKIWALGQ